MCVTAFNNHVLYSSANTSYCDATDATCQTCYSDWSATQWSSMSNPSCTGSDGCVCLRICETPSWTSRVLSDQGCLWAFSYGNQQGMVSTVFEFAIMAVVVLGFFKLTSFFVARFLSRRERTGEECTLDGWLPRARVSHLVSVLATQSTALAP